MIIKLRNSYAKEIRPLMIDNGPKPGFRIGNIGINTYINGMEVHMNEGNEIVNLQIGNYCSIGDSVLALINRDHDYGAVSTSALLPLRPEMKKRGQIVIGHDVWIGNQAILMAGAKIGNGAVIGAGAIVKKEAPPYAVVVGNPMRIVRYRFSPNG